MFNLYCNLLNFEIKNNLQSIIMTFILWLCVCVYIYLVIDYVNKDFENLRHKKFIINWAHSAEQLRYQQNVIKVLK